MITLCECLRVMCHVIYQMVALEEEMRGLRDAGTGGWFQTMHLPEGMAVTSSDVIASLNEHLVQTLQVHATGSEGRQSLHQTFGK